jgi:VanZ family protein
MTKPSEQPTEQPTQQPGQMVKQARIELSFVLYCLSSLGMVVVLVVASCTSQQMFVEIYRLVAEFLLFSKTSLSLTLRESPGLGHFLCYCLLSFSLSGVFSRRFILFAPLVAVVFGMLMEGVQIFIPSRDASFGDIGINLLGVGVGVGLYFLWGRVVGVLRRVTGFPLSRE